MDKTHAPVTRRSFLYQLTAGAAAVAACPAILRAAPKTYTNPVYAGSMPDPFVLKHAGAYYAFGTTGAERKSDGRIFTVLRSTNLVDWRESGGALTPPTSDTDYQY